MIAAINARISVAVVWWLLAIATSSALADGTSVLWSRACDIRNAVCDGEWQRVQAYEAERWCRAARIAAVDWGLTIKGRQTAERRGAVMEYQCLPDTVDPRGPKGK
jgi:hypothetical protein